MAPPYDLFRFETYNTGRPLFPEDEWEVMAGNDRHLQIQFPRAHFHTYLVSPRKLFWHVYADSAKRRSGAVRFIDLMPAF